MSYLKARFIEGMTNLEYIQQVVECGSLSEFYSHYKKILEVAPYELIDLLDALEEYDNGRIFIKTASDKWKDEKFKFTKLDNFRSVRGYK
ncbi:MAG TPA: hypothetical protein VI911_12230 [Patescibacteria group bacterium]|nr:hypothetical protein [Patescibacteria group bacterium]